MGRRQPVSASDIRPRLIITGCDMRYDIDGFGNTSRAAGPRWRDPRRDDPRGGLHLADVRPAAFGRDRALARISASTLTNLDLFPLNGVTLGRTSMAELRRLGHRSRYIDDQTGEPFRCYQVDGINFWYLDGNVAESVFLAHGTPIPERWRTLGFSWTHSFDHYGELLRRLGFDVVVTRQPATRWFSDRRSFSAELEGRRQGDIGLRIKLDFDFGDGTKAGDIETLYSIDVAVAG